MEATLYAPGIICVAGALIFAFATGKGGELGRIMFGCGLLAALMHIAR